MSLQDWVANRWLRSHTTSPEEISNLLAVAARYISDAGKNISTDGKFMASYNAALALCSVLLYAEGYRSVREREHYRTIQAMPLILGGDRAKDAKYLDDCRMKRNVAQYESAGVVSKDEVQELVEFVKAFRSDVVEWLGQQHPELLES